MYLFLSEDRASVSSWNYKYLKSFLRTRWWLEFLLKNIKDILSWGYLKNVNKLLIVSEVFI